MSFVRLLAAAFAVGFVLSWRRSDFATKTLWDWMELLVVPVVLFLGAHLYTERRTRVERETADARAREHVFQTYLDRVEALLLKEGGPLSGSSDWTPLRDVARARTLSALRALDASRRGALVRFLYESGLIGWTNRAPIIALRGADLAGADLSWADIAGAHLGGAHLSEARLDLADLRGCDISVADMRGADLREAHLSGACLRGAGLRGANLSFAELDGVDLRESDLREVDIANADLTNANLSNAFLCRIRNLTQGQLDSTASYADAQDLPSGLTPDLRG